MRRSIWSRLRYPKFLLLIVTFVFAYFIYRSGKHIRILEFIVSLGFVQFVFSFAYVDAFIIGMLFSYGFTAAPATAMLLLLAQSYNIYLTAVVAGLGAVVGDLLIFHFIRSTFVDEIRKLERERVTRYLQRKLPDVVKKYFIPLLGGFIIASPLPDEVGVALFAVSKDIPKRLFSVISFVLNTVGILIVLLIGRTL